MGGDDGPSHHSTSASRVHPRLTAHDGFLQDDAESVHISSTFFTILKLTRSKQADFLDPVIPEPLPPAQNSASCLSALDVLDAWDCALSRLTTLADIPRPFRSKWAHTYDRVLQHMERPNNNQDALGVDRVLKLFLILNQLLLRQGGRGGKRVKQDRA